MTLGRMKGEYQFPNGFIYIPEFITENEEEKLLSFIATINFEEVLFREQIAKRQIKNYGMDYEFDTRAIVPGEPIPKELHWLKDKAAAFAQMSSEALIECLVSKYPPGAPIGWHRDAYVFGSKVIGISLSSSCIMRFQRASGQKRLVYEQELQPRSLYIIGGEARYKWQHSIPPAKKLRYSITFRSLKAS